MEKDKALLDLSLHGEIEANEERRIKTEEIVCNENHSGDHCDAAEVDSASIIQTTPIFWIPNPDPDPDPNPNPLDDDSATMGRGCVESTESNAVQSNSEFPLQKLPLVHEKSMTSSGSETEHGVKIVEEEEEEEEEDEDFSFLRDSPLMIKARSFYSHAAREFQRAKYWRDVRRHAYLCKDVRSNVRKEDIEDTVCAVVSSRFHDSESPPAFRDAAIIRGDEEAISAFKRTTGENINAMGRKVREIGAMPGEIWTKFVSLWTSDEDVDEEDVDDDLPSSRPAASAQPLDERGALRSDSNKTSNNLWSGSNGFLNDGGAVECFDRGQDEADLREDRASSASRSNNERPMKSLSPVDNANVNALPELPEIPQRELLEESYVINNVTENASPAVSDLSNEALLGPKRVFKAKIKRVDPSEIQINELEQRSLDEDSKASKAKTEATHGSKNASYEDVKRNVREALFSSPPMLSEQQQQQAPESEQQQQSPGSEQRLQILSTQPPLSEGGDRDAGKCGVDGKTLEGKRDDGEGMKDGEEGEGEGRGEGEGGGNGSMLYPVEVAGEGIEVQISTDKPEEEDFTLDVKMAKEIKEECSQYGLPAFETVCFVSLSTKTKEDNNSISETK